MYLRLYNLYSLQGIRPTSFLAHPTNFLEISNNDSHIRGGKFGHLDMLWARCRMPSRACVDNVLMTSGVVIPPAPIAFLCLVDSLATLSQC
ncbi:hypothetical protein RRG08_017662 [Elysia crispata]|uniref:Uncharacterized protein n=1 Tax=Elysia crispata TaxID=231223 RepID=A0AAE0ZC90_9GAST|nr:hypothetical protein RRG08_017662 [Elysia crispata]